MGRQSARPFGSAEGGARTYAAETAAILAAMPTQPASEWCDAIDDLVLALKAAGVWSKTDLLYWIGAHAAGSALINWKAPGTLNLTTAGTLTFAAKTGYKGDGSTGYLTAAVGYNGLTHYGQTAGFVCGWVESGTDDTGTRYISGQVDGTQRHSLSPRAGGVLAGRIGNGTASAIGSIESAHGFTLLNRPDASTLRGLKNGALAGTQALGTNSNQTGNIALLRHLTSYSPYELSMWACGGPLSEAEEGALYTALAAYRSAIAALS